MRDRVVVVAAVVVSKAVAGSSVARERHEHAGERHEARARAHVVEPSPAPQHALQPRAALGAALARVHEPHVEREHARDRVGHHGDHDAAAREPEPRRAGHGAPAAAAALEKVDRERAEPAADGHGALQPRGVEVHAPEVRRLERELARLEQRRVLRHGDVGRGASEEPREPRGCDLREGLEVHWSAA